MLRFIFFLLISSYGIHRVYLDTHKVNVKLSEIWGPGLTPEITMQARYFFIRLVDYHNKSVSHTSGEFLDVLIDGISKSKKPCRLWTNLLETQQGFYIVRYKLYETCTYLNISIVHEKQHILNSPYIFNNPIYPDGCSCSRKHLENVIEHWNCGDIPTIIKNKLGKFGKINWSEIRKKVITNFDKPHSISICHYVIKKNSIYRRCYGKYVGFNMFIDAILLSLTRKVVLPDLEFFSNLGDWPLSTYNLPDRYPIFSWCGSTDSYDIIMPTYDITESTLENMGRVTLDILSVQGNVQHPWELRLPKLFWRGRDSNKYRLKLMELSKQYPELFNVSLTNFFFYRDEEYIYGPKSEHISFFKFFDYKYQLAIDGTVAPYRMPYLLAGGSLIFKPESKYYEHFYNNLLPYVHYIPVETDLSDLVEKIKWAIQHDEESYQIAKNGQQFANDNLLPKNIFCYHIHLFNELNKVIVSPIEVLEGMEYIEQTKLEKCECVMDTKDEL